MRGFPPSREPLSRVFACRRSPRADALARPYVAFRLSILRTLASGDSVCLMAAAKPARDSTSSERLPRRPMAAHAPARERRILHCYPGHERASTMGDR